MNSGKHDSVEIAIIVPLYSCRRFLEELYNRLVATLESMGVSFRLIFVDDCGPDRPWTDLVSMCEKDSRVVAIRFARNFGQHYAISAGLEHADATFSVVMDGDLQDRPEEIPKLYAEARKGFDVVIAIRPVRKDRFLKRMSSRLFYLVLNSFSDLQFDPRAGNFRIISRKVVENYLSMREQLRIFGGLIAWMGFDTAKIEVEHAPRAGGGSSYSIGKLLGLAINVIIAYSEKPLRFSIFVGLLSAALAFVYGIYVIGSAVVGDTAVAGWASLIVSLYFIGGLILASLGVLGLYIGKIFEQTKGRPLYVVSEVIQGSSRR